MTAGRQKEVRGERDSRSTLKRLLFFLSPGKWLISAALLLICLSAGVQLIIPIYFGRVFLDQILIGGQNLHLLNIIALSVLGLFLIKGIFNYGQVYLLAYAGHKLVYDLRNSLFAHLQRLSLRYYDQTRTGETIARMTNDITLIQTGLTTGLRDFLMDILTLLGILVFLFYLHWRLSLITLVTFPLVILAVNIYGRRIRRFTGLMQEKVGDISSQLQETFIGIRVIKAFTMEEGERERFKARNYQTLQAGMKSAQTLATVTPVVELFMVAGMVLVFWYGAQEVVKGHLTTGELTAFIGYLGMASAPINGLTRAISLFQQSLAAGDRVFQLLDEEVEIKEPPHPIVLPEVRGRVVFENVAFAYRSGEPVLENINLTVEPGEVVALVGKSGTGKSTLVNLLPRFYDPTAGRVTLDGHDLRSLNIKWLRSQIGLVPQETILFGVTIGENIRYGRPEASQSEVEEAARRANAYDFIMRLPQGFETVVGERGVTLSGGQRQRIAIARAILRNPRLLILDEATSSLDAESEITVQEALSRLMKERTTFVIAHRLTTVMGADRILVIEDGRIAEEGSHEELLSKGGLYCQLYEAQFRQEAEGAETDRGSGSDGK
ncbi:MAG TPA: ABC transporter ATP-binding protein [Firmicutes bacterium]|nr:ABC transporter ATP-binding protein [Bacillota bacterium]